MKKLISLLLGLAVVGGGLFYYFIEKDNNRMIKKTVQCVINTDYDPYSAINAKGEKYEQIKGEIHYEGEVDTSKVGEYTVTYQVEDQTYECKVKVVDQTAPVFTTKENTVRINQLANYAYLFVEKVEDESAVTFSVENKDSIKEPGDYTLTIVGKDESGNTSKQEVEAHILEADLEAPVLTGITDLSIAQNAAVNLYSNITISDNLDPNPTYEIDSSGLDYTKPGSYQIIYKAYDDCGNSNEYTRNITVTDDVSPTEKVIYLTFDDGPSKNTPEVLKILDQYNVKATFFVTGINPQYYDLLKEENNAGHALAIHTMHHQYENIYSSLDAYIEDFNEIQTLVRSYVGYNLKIFRFPGGSSNQVSMKYCEGVVSEIANWANEQGYTYVDWNIISGDGNVNTSYTDMINIVKSSRLPSQITLLCHDSGAAVNTVKALPTIIQYYQSLGYTFKIIDQNTEVIHHTIKN